MQVLVTGAGGFVGGYMLEELAAHGHTPISLGRHVGDTARSGTPWHTCDIRDRTSLEEIIDHVQPDACIHLAGIAFVPEGGTSPDAMLTVNSMGTINLLEAFRNACPTARILSISTAHVYGTCTRDRAVPEDAPLRPVSVYAISKAASDVAALGYAESWDLDVMTARPNNHTGPGQCERFVLPGLLAQARAIAAGKAPPVIHAGNMESERDFTDVRDVVRAYRLLIEKGQPGMAYNIGSGTSVSIGAVLARICRLFAIQPEIRIDPDKFRPTDRSPILDVSRIAQHTGWQPRIPLDRTLENMAEGS